MDCNSLMFNKKEDVGRRALKLERSRVAKLFFHKKHYRKVLIQSREDANELMTIK